MADAAELSTPKNPLTINFVDSFVFRLDVFGARNRRVERDSTYQDENIRDYLGARTRLGWWRDSALRDRGPSYNPLRQLRFAVGLAPLPRSDPSSSMTDVTLLALSRAWVASLVASAVLLASVAIEQVWNSAVYWRALPEAIELSGNEGPLPIVDQRNGTTANNISSQPPAGAIDSVAKRQTTRRTVDLVPVLFPIF